MYPAVGGKPCQSSVSVSEFKGDSPIARFSNVSEAETINCLKNTIGTINRVKPTRFPAAREHENIVGKQNCGTDFNRKSHQNVVT